MTVVLNYTFFADKKRDVGYAVTPSRFLTICARITIVALSYLGSDKR
jgi:hypothetical protein